MKHLHWVISLKCICFSLYLACMNYVFGIYSHSNRITVPAETHVLSQQGLIWFNKVNFCEFQTKNHSIIQTIDEVHSACLSNVCDMTEASATGYFLVPATCLAAEVAAFPGIWIPAWGDVSALLWDHYSDGQSAVINRFMGFLGSTRFVFRPYLFVLLI